MFHAGEYVLGLDLTIRPLSALSEIVGVEVNTEVRKQWTYQQLPED